MPFHFWLFFLGILIFFVLWALIQVLRETKKRSISKDVRDQFSGYIKFLSSYDKASHAENEGDLSKALDKYIEALNYLKADKRKDKLVEKNIDELEEKIDKLRQSLSQESY
jgi:predicted ribosome quality control (RQC) complex YloA/Tae2 family protein